MANKNFNYSLLGIILLLLIVGFIILTSASVFISPEKNPYYFVKRQFIFGFLPGLLFAIFLYKIDLEKLKKYSLWLLISGLFLNFLLFVPFLGVKAGGATRWLNVGFFTFQPSEILKLFFIIYLAAWLTNKINLEEKINFRKKNRFRYQQIFYQLIPFLIILATISVLIIKQKDLGTLIVIAFIALTMYFCAKTPLWHNLLIAIIGIAVVISLISFSPYRLQRLLTFLYPDLDPMGSGYQAKQAEIAIGSAGFWGKGLGLSQQKLGFLPQPTNDSIFAVLAEETGFLGSLLLILFFLIFLFQGLKIVKEAQNYFERLIAIGIISYLCFQAFINIGANIGLFPLTGIPLPFISYGGTALAIELASVGILLNISKKKKNQF
jgi:cell division protein FtsW